MEVLPLVSAGVEAGSKSRRHATAVKRLAPVSVSFTEFKLMKISLNLNYTVINGKTNCAF